MRLFVPTGVFTSSLLAAIAVGCSSGGGATGGDGGPDVNPTVDGSAADGAVDGTTGSDASADANDDGGDPNLPPSVQFIGRFDTTDMAGPQFAWPGTQVVARFNGTGVSVKLSRTFAGYDGGPSWINVLVDGVVQAPFSVSGTAENHVLATGLTAGPHTVVIEKRNEAKHGTVRFEGFTFEGGELLSPPPRLARKIEFIAESTIDGFGVEGNRTTTCVGTSPAEFDNVRKSVATFTATAVQAESHVTAYSGKGISINNFGGDTLTMPMLWNRALPDPGAGSNWNTASWVPDVIVISLGGVDYKDGVAAAPADFQAKYAAFVASLRTAYGNGPQIVLTVWSQIKNNGGDQDIRTAVTAALDGVIATRAGAGDSKVTKLVFPEANVNTDETGCYYHANEAHHQAMATVLSQHVKTVAGW